MLSNETKGASALVLQSGLIASAIRVPKNCNPDSRLGGVGFNPDSGGFDLDRMGAWSPLSAYAANSHIYIQALSD